MKSRAQYICISVDVVSKYIYILQIFVYSTPLACWECACLDEVARRCMYASMDMVDTVYTYCMDEVACSMYTYCHDSSTQLRLPTGSVPV